MISQYQQNQMKGLRLDANESPWNLPEWLMAEILDEISKVEFNRYPDDEYRKLREAYANTANVKPEEVLAGNGSDQMIQLMINAFAGKEGDLAVLDPDFSMYDFYASCLRKGISKFPLDFNGLDLDGWIEKIKEEKPFLVIFSNPHNPSGTMLSRDQVKKLAEEIAPIPLLVDEAYMDFDGESSIPLINELDNLYVTRTLSKAYGLASCRIGFLISNPENIRKVSPYKIVYNIPEPTSKIAQTVLRHHKVFNKRIEFIKDEREKMSREIEKLDGIKLIPSHANYLCIIVENPEKLAEAFQDRDIAVRVFPGREYLRISIGSERENERVLHVLREYSKRLKEEKK